MEPGKRYAIVLPSNVNVKLEAFEVETGSFLFDPDHEAVMPAMLPPPGMIPIYEAHRMLMEAVAQATKPFVEAMANLSSSPVYVAMPPDQPQIEQLLDELRQVVKQKRDAYPQLLAFDHLTLLCGAIEDVIKKWEGGQERGKR